MKYKKFLSERVFWCSLTLGTLVALGAAAGQPLKTAPGPTNAVGASGQGVSVGVRELLRHPDKYVGAPLVLEGLVTEVCPRKGCWALLRDTDPEARGQIRVKQDDDASSFKAFLPEVQGRTLLVRGQLHETRIDARYLDNWEARLKATPTSAETEAAPEAVRKQLAALRERLANSTNGYLISLGFSVSGWETKSSKP